MNKVISKDGTQIAYETKGAGPTVIVVDAAFCYRSFGPSPHLAELLAPRFMVYIYDRRGRGESGNSKPFAVAREVEDIDALITEAGGSAFLYGYSSGACLALEAAMALGDKVKKLAMYEAPYNSDPATLPVWQRYRKTLNELIAANRRSDAVEWFMQFVGNPPEQINGMRQTPMWQTLEAVAPTLPYDAAAMGEDRSTPVKRAANLKVPVLVLDGGANLEFMPFMHRTATELAGAIPQAEQLTLEGQTHDVNLEVLAPVLAEFFSR